MLKLLYVFNSGQYSDSDGLDFLGFGSQYYKILLFSTAFRPTLGLTQPPTQWVPRALSPGKKRPGREADHSPPSSIEVKIGGAI
jgi:hypothetical protein